MGDLFLLFLNYPEAGPTRQWLRPAEIHRRRGRPRRRGASGEHQNLGGGSEMAHRGAKRTAETMEGTATRWRARWDKPQGLGWPESTPATSLTATKFGHRRSHRIRGQNARGWAPNAST